MGFLFDTLEKAGGQNCQATNFLKTFNGIPQGKHDTHERGRFLTHRTASRLGLLEENAPSSSLTDMIQAASRFMLAQIREDFRRIAPNTWSFDRVSMAMRF